MPDLPLATNGRPAEPLARKPRTTLAVDVEAEAFRLATQEPDELATDPPLARKNAAQKAAEMAELRRLADEETARYDAMRDADLERRAAEDPAVAAQLAEVRAFVGVVLERRGPSYRVYANPLRLAITFREVRTDRDLSADVSVSLAGRHLFRTTSTLSIAGRDKIAKTAADFSGAKPVDVRRAVFAAVEAVLEAEEQIAGAEDMRAGSLADAGPLWLIERFWPTGPTMLLMPASGGKSTEARALAVSIASGVVAIPGLVPTVRGPVLYVAAEDSVAVWHRRSIEAICRGLGIDRTRIEHAIRLQPTGGRSMHRIARSLAEQAVDYAAVILDSQNALLGTADFGQIQDRDRRFWDEVEELRRPTLVLSHPNREDSRRWHERSANQRAAGTEIHQQRARMAWAGRWRDEKAAVGSTFRRYTFDNAKWSHGIVPPVAFAVSWQLGLSAEDPGSVRFMASEPFGAEPVDTEPRPSKAVAETLAAISAGNDTPEKLQNALGLVNFDAARKRLQRAKAWREEHREEDE